MFFSRMVECTSQIAPLRGFSLLGTAVGMALISAMGLGLLSMGANSQKTRTSILQQEQAYYSSHASLEYALRNIRVLGNPDPLPARDFIGANMSVTYEDGQCGQGQLVTVQSIIGDAAKSFTLGTGGGPVSNDCVKDKLQFANWAGASYTDLEGVEIQNKNSECGSGPWYITGMMISWTPDNGEKVTQIQIEGSPYEYNDATGLPSGSIFGFGDNDFMVNDNQWKDLTLIRFDSNMATNNPAMTIQWFIDELPQCLLSEFTPS